MRPSLATLKIRLARALSVLEAKLFRLRRAILPAPVVVFEDVSAHWLSSLVSAAAASGLDQALDGRPRPVPELAEQLEIPAPQLRRLVRTLAPYGYFKLDPKDRVSHTRLSRSLAREGNGFARLQGSDWYRSSFLSPEAAMATSKSGFEFNQGKAFFSFLEEHPEACDTFAGAMTCVSAYTAEAVAQAFPFHLYESVLDVGGGRGVLVQELGRRFPHLKVALMDRAEVVESAGEGAIAGDFFQAVPHGHQLLILKNILHDWEDDLCLKILKNCRETGSDLLIIELLLPADSSLSPAWLVDFNVWMTLGGRERTRDEYEQLLSAGGFRLKAVYPTFTPFSVLHATSV